MEQYAWIGQAIEDSHYIQLDVFPILNRMAEHFNVNIEILGPKHFDLDAYVQAIYDATDRGVNGMIVNGWGGELEIVAAIDRAMDSGIPVVITDNDILNAKRLACVSTDWGSIGANMGRHMRRMIGPKGRVLMIGYSGVGKRQLGFQYFAETFQRDPGIEVIRPKIDEPRDGQLLSSQLEEYIKLHHDDLLGIAAFTTPSGLVAAEVIERMDLAEKPALFTTDISPKHRAYIKKGIIDATACLNRGAATARAFQILHQYCRKLPAKGLHTSEVEISTHLEISHILFTADNIDKVEQYANAEAYIAEFDLTEQIGLLSQMVEQVDEIAISTDSQGKITYLNPTTEQVLKQNKNQLLEKPLRDYFEISDSLWTEIQATIAEGQSISFETQVGKDRIPAQMTISPLAHSTGTGAMVAIATNLSKQKKIESELRQHHEEERMFFARQVALTDVRNDLSLLDNRDDLARRAVELGRERLGFERIGIWWVDLENNLNQGSFGIDEFGNLTDERHKISSPISDLYFELQHKRFILLQNTPVKNDAKQIIGKRDAILVGIWGGDRTIGVMGIDNLLNKSPITENDCELAVQFASTIGHIFTRIVANQKLAEESNLLHSVIEALPVEIFVKNIDNKYMLCNTRFAKSKLGMSGNEASGKTLDDLLVPDKIPYFQEQDDVILKQGQPMFEVERPTESNDNSEKWEYVCKVPLKNSQGDVTGIIGMVQDITSRIVAERSLRIRNELDREYQSRLMNMIHIREQLSELDSTDEICRKAVEFGRHKLGFDRMGIWFTDNKQKHLFGKFGTNLKQDTIDRRSVKIPNLPTWKKLSATNEYALFEFNAIKTGQQESTDVPTATRIVSPIWDGRTICGYLVADNAIDFKTITDRDGELVTTYASILGHLFSKHQSAKTLAEERNLLQTVIENIPAQIYAKDRQGRYLISNTAFETRRGKSKPQELIGKTLYDLFPADTAKRIDEHDQQIMQSGNPMRNAEAEFTAPGGIKTWESTTKVPLFDNQGQIIGLVGMTHDITRIKMADETLRQNEARERRLARKLRMLIDIRDRLATTRTLDELARLAVELGRIRLGLERTGIWMLGEKPNMLYGIYGSDEHGLETIDLQGESFSVDLLPSNITQIPRHVSHIQFAHDGTNYLSQATENSYTVVFAPIREGEQLIGFFQGDNKIRKSPITEQDLEFIALYASTISQLYSRQKAASTLAEERNLMQTVIDNLPMKIFVTDATDHHLVCNTEFALERERQSIDDVIGATTDDLYSKAAADHIKQVNRHIIETGENLIDDQEQFTRKNGQSGWQSITKVPLRNHDGKAIGVVGLSRDITTYKLAEEALKESEEHYRYMATSNRRLLREVNHRVRNNLASLLSLLAITRERTKTVDEFSKSMEQRISAMSQIHNLLAEAGWKDLNLRTLVNNLIKSFHQTGQNIIAIDIDGPSVPVSSSQALPLAMSLLELFINSTKYGAHTSSDGQLTINWTTQPDPKGAKVTIRWIETGGPPIIETPKPSLGTELVQGFINFELGGRCKLRYPPTGADHTIRFTALETDTPVPHDLQPIA